MHKISLISPNYQVGPRELNSYYLPYSCGILWQYAKTSPLVNKHFILDQMIWRRDSIEEVAQRLKDNDIIGLSTYIWNRKYNIAVAKRIKELNPHVFIIGGGPELPITRANFFEEFPFIDIHVKNEGEYVFQEILECYATDKKYDSIKGIILNKDNKVLDTGDAERIDDVDTIPSPYLEGMFDNIMEQNPDVKWSVIFETNRGCPYACTFCDWGSLTYSKIKQFNLDRVFAELEWFGQKGIDFIYVTDANFGIFPERDYSIAQKLLSIQKTYNAPSGYSLTWAKNQKADVIEIAKLFKESGSSLGLNLSVQSLDDNTLEIIKRKNMEMNRIEDVFNTCEEARIPLFTELICGLPGETLDTWKNNFYKLYEANNHTGISVYQCALLENAEMNLIQRKEFEIEGTMVHDYILGSENDPYPELRESVEIVKSTRDLKGETMIDAMTFGWFQVTFHVGGLTNYISRFLNKHVDESYKDFYDKFWKYLETTEWGQNEIKRIKDFYRHWLNSGEVQTSKIGNVTIYAMNLIHSTTIRMHYENDFDYVKELIRMFVEKEYADIVSADVIDSLLDFQNYLSIDFKSIKQYPITKSFNHNIASYVQNDADLYTPAEYTFIFPEDNSVSKDSFCEKIFYARRQQYGKAEVKTVYN